MPLVFSAEPDPFITQFHASEASGTYASGRRAWAHKKRDGAESPLIVRSTDLFEGDPDNVPGPPKEMRWGGRCRFLPMRWAEEIRARMSQHVAVRAYCFSCNANLLPEHNVAPEGEPERWEQMDVAPGIIALAKASDHDRACMNHQIVLLDANHNLLARSPYNPLSMSW